MFRGNFVSHMAEEERRHAIKIHSHSYVIEQNPSHGRYHVEVFEAKTTKLASVPRRTRTGVIQHVCTCNKFVVHK